MAGEDYLWRLPYWIRTNPTLMAEWEIGVAEFGYETAEEYVRSTDAYLIQFPEIRREDGSYRMDENEYLANMDSYRASLGAVGVNADLFGEQFIELIKGEVSGAEFWQERVAPIYDRVMDRGDEMMQRYADDWGLEMSREALIASLLDPDMIGSKILNRQIGISEIRAEGDLTIGSEMTDKYAALTEELYDRDTTLGQTRDLMQRADQLMPALEVLASRHADPDDTFDLEEFTQATLWNDPEQARRMRRLISQEQSLFTGSGQINYTKSKAGGVAGLANS